MTQFYLRTRKSDEVAASSDFLLSGTYYLWYIQQCKLRLSPFEQHGVPFPLVVAESDILPIDVPVARLQLSDQRAFGNLSAPQKPVWTDIVGERGKEQTVTPELAEHGAELPQVFPQKRVRLSLRHGACRIPFPRLQPVSIPHIRVMFFRVPAFKILRTPNCPLERRQAVDCRLPVRPLLTAVRADTEQTASSEQRIAMNTRIILAEVCNCLWG